MSDDRGRGGGYPGGRRFENRPEHCNGCGQLPDNQRLRGGYCENCLMLAQAGEALLNSREYPQYFRPGVTNSRGGSVIARDYVDAIPNQLALLFATEDTKKRLTKHQLRDFYHQAKRTHRAVRSEKDYVEMEERLAKLAAHAQARLGRENIPASFKVFIDKNVSRVKDKETLAAFASHFESVVAYCEGRLDKERGS